jgi:hypothetical protein
VSVDTGKPAGAAFQMPSVLTPASSLARCRAPSWHHRPGFLSISMPCEASVGLSSTRAPF